MKRTSRQLGASFGNNYCDNGNFVEKAEKVSLKVQVSGELGRDRFLKDLQDSPIKGQ
ncbi:MAG: hypothetical protein SVY10_14875 [Thermodesulfobacteriota bacterium]|nr:hypothetical protein [Thermodesulfobacteriota bacterium]